MKILLHPPNGVVADLPRRKGPGDVLCPDGNLSFLESTEQMLSGLIIMNTRHLPVIHEQRPVGDSVNCES
jgi:hypothetical protein